MAAIGFLSKALLILAILVAVAAYCLWTPLPEDMDQKGLLRAVGIFARFMSVMANILPVFLGNKTKLDIQRMGLNFLSVAALDSDPLLQVTNEVFGGVPVRVYRPKSAPVPSPVSMYFHAGGWVTGNVDLEDHISRYLAKHTNVAFVSVEYRLAPEHPFPAALDDCVAATVHMLENGQQLGFDTSRVGVFGGSAGGNLAAAVPLRLLDEEFQNRSLPKLKYQVLMLPPLQGLDFTLPSYVDNDAFGAGALSQEMMVLFYQHYAGLGDSPATTEQMMKGQHVRKETRSKFAKYVHRDLITGSKNEVVDREEGETVNETLASLAEPVLLDYRLSPLLAPDDLLKLVPPAFVAFSHYDVLRDDGALYVRRLRQAGVEVTPHLIKNGNHITMAIVSTEPGSETAAETYENICKFVRDHSKS